MPVGADARAAARRSDGQGRVAEPPPVAPFPSDFRSRRRAPLSAVRGAKAPDPTGLSDGGMASATPEAILAHSL